MLDLSSVTLICAASVVVPETIKSFERCKTVANFGAVKLLTDVDTDYEHAIKIPRLNTHVEYSLFCLYRLHEFVDTRHMLIAQHDSWIINPQTWDPSWLNYSFIGPLFIHQHKICNLSVGTGGFSLRDRDLMAHASTLGPRWDHSDPESTRVVQERLGNYEDGAVSFLFRGQLEAKGFTYAPPNEAVKFAQGGNTDKDYWFERPFGFHGFWPNINHDTGVVSPFAPRHDSWGHI